MRHRRDEFGGQQPAPIRGGKFTFRTFHPPARVREGTEFFTLDRLMTVTLAAIEGEDHKMIAHMEVAL